MRIYHTSGAEIKEIEKDGQFDDMLFFSEKPYVMTAANTIFTYYLEIDDDKILDIERVFYEYDPADHPKLQEIVDNVAERFGISDDDAMEIIDDSEPMISEDCEGSWWIQAQQGHVARALGYDAAMSRDEQGTVYIVPMIGREEDLFSNK